MASMPCEGEVMKTTGVGEAASLRDVQSLAHRLKVAFDPVRMVLRDKSVEAKPKVLGVALGYILTSAFKTFSALVKVCDVGEPWGLQGMVFSRMLFENYVTARWLAARPAERAKLFIEFGHIAEVQSALIKGEFDNRFFARGHVAPGGRSQLRGQFFRVLPLFCKLKPGQGITKKQVLRQKWTYKSLPCMIKDLGERELDKDYKILHFFSSSVVHGTPFAARANIADDLTYRWTPDPQLASAALSAGLEYFLKLTLFCDQRLCLGQRSALEALQHASHSHPANEHT